MKRNLSIVLLTAIAILSGALIAPLLVKASYGPPLAPNITGTYSVISGTTCNSFNIGQIAIVDDSPNYTARCSGSAWVYYYGSYVVTPPASLSWSSDNIDSTTIGGVGATVFLTSATGDVEELHIRYTATPAAPYKVDVLLAKHFQNWTSDARYGVVFRESSSSKIIDFEHGNTSAAGYLQLIQKWTNSTTASSTYDGGASNNNIPVFNESQLWFRVANDNTNLSFWWSVDGANFVQFGSSRAKADFFTTAPDAYGVTIGHVNGAVSPAVSVIAIKTS